MLHALEDEDDFLLKQFGSEERRTYNRIIQNNIEEDCTSEPSNREYGDEEEAGRVTDADSFYEDEDELQDELLNHPLRDFVVDPTGDLYYAWQGIVGISVFYNIIFTIMRIAFEQLEYYWWVFWIADLATDIIYATDMVVQMSISYIDDGIYITDKAQLKENYLKTARFAYDALSILPLPYLALLTRLAYCIFRHLIGLTDVGFSVPVFEITLIGFCRLPRLLKYKALSELFASMESRTNAPDTFRAFNLIVYLLVIIHWIACVYYCISWFEGFGMNGWVYPATEEGDGEHLFLRKYTVCFYWSFLTLTTIGGSSDPETNLEYLFTGLTFFNGVFVFAAVVGNVGDVISNMNAARTEFQAKVDDIKRYMVHHRVPESLQKRVKKWFDYSWGRTHGVDESSLLETLPDKLRARIQIQIHLKTLKKVTIFEKCENGLLCELVLKLRPQIFSPRDYVCKRNEIGKEMYIINHGKLECIVTTESGERIVVATLTEGKYFGEIALLSFEGNNRRTADVRSVGYSELLVLSKKALMSALVDYPEARKQLEYQAQLRISSNRKMSSALKESSSSSAKTSNSSKPLLKKAFSRMTDQNQHVSPGKDEVAMSSSSTLNNTAHLTDTTELKDREEHYSIDNIQHVITQLKAFDCMATKQRIAELEKTICNLKEGILAKSREHEEAMLKLQALQELHASPAVALSSRGLGSSPPCASHTAPLHNNLADTCNGGNGSQTNGHDSSQSRYQKVWNLKARMKERRPVEESVSDRTRNILESMRREQLLSASVISSTPSSISRQSSFLIDDWRDQRSGSHSVSNLLREQDPATVRKYLKNTEHFNYRRSMSQSMRGKRNKKRTSRSSLAGITKLEAISSKSHSHTLHSDTETIANNMGVQATLTVTRDVIPR